MTLVEQLLQSS